MNIIPSESGQSIRSLQNPQPDIRSGTLPPLADANGEPVLLAEGDTAEAEVAEAKPDGKIALKTPDGRQFLAELTADRMMVPGQKVTLTVTGVRGGVPMAEITGQGEPSAGTFLKAMKAPATEQNLALAREALIQQAPFTPKQFAALSKSFAEFAGFSDPLPSSSPQRGTDPAPRGLPAEQAVFMARHNIPVDRETVARYKAVTQPQAQLGALLHKLLNILPPQPGQSAPPEPVPPPGAIISRAVPQPTAPAPQAPMAPADAQPFQPTAPLMPPDTLPPQPLRQTAEGGQSAQQPPPPNPGIHGGTPPPTPPAAQPFQPSAPFVPPDIQQPPSAPLPEPPQSAQQIQQPPQQPVQLPQVETARPTAAEPVPQPSQPPPVPEPISRTEPQQQPVQLPRPEAPQVPAAQSAAQPSQPPQPARQTAEGGQGAQPPPPANPDIHGGTLPSIRELIDALFTKVSPGRIRQMPVEMDIPKQTREIGRLITSILEQAGNMPEQTRSEALSTAREIVQTLRFSEQISHCAAFAQLPVAINGERTTAQLYVFNDSTEKKRIDPQNATLFVSLTTANLGTVEGFVKIIGTGAEADFALQTEEAAGLFRAGLPELRELLEARGYRLERVNATVARAEPRAPAAVEKGRLEMAGRYKFNRTV